MASLKDRTGLLKDVVGWWLAPSPARLREIARQVEGARALSADPFDSLDDDICRLWPVAASQGDPRWEILSHEGAQDNTNPDTKAHWRCALVMAWLDLAPDALSRTWARGMLIDRTDLSCYSQPMNRRAEEYEQARLRAGVRCALSLDRSAAKMPPRPQGEAFEQWAMGLAMAMGWQDEMDRCAPASAPWALPGAQALLWAALNETWMSRAPPGGEGPILEPGKENP